MDRYVVIGNPVSHSLSPAIHARFARQTREAIEYSTLAVPEGKFMLFAQRFFDEGGAGANVTLPFKMNAYHWAGARTPRAEIAEAANFLISRSGRIEADNTDGAGLIADLTANLHKDLAGIAILILGAGGAVRGVLAPLLEARPRRVVIANRTPARARELATRFAALGPVEAASLDALPREDFDLIVNATSAATRGEALELPRGAMRKGALAYDMAYGPAARPFVEGARSLGLEASDGLGMLVEQAAESFRLWRGVRPETAPVLAALRAQQA
jgi:shikimate dehydrogenase